MPAETIKILARASFAAGQSTVYTVPARTMTIIRQIHVCAAVNGSTVTLYENSATLAGIFLPPKPLNANEYGVWDGAITMSAGDTLLVNVSGPSVAITVHGMEIT